MRSAVVVAPCPFDADPRHSYWSLELQRRGFRVLEVEVVESPRRWRSIAEKRIEVQRVSLFSSVSTSSQSTISAMLCQIPMESSTGHFLKRQFLRTAAAIELSKEYLQNADLVIANDLAGIIGVLHAELQQGPKFVYDAQEIFTDSYDFFVGEPLTSAERLAWQRIETEAVQIVDHLVTVSPGIADLYEARHARRPAVLPNYAPQQLFLGQGLSREPGPIRFVFLGRADPYRGLEELVDNWDFDPEIATLDLFIPKSSAQKDLIKRSKRIKRNFSGPLFRDAVKPNQIVQTLSRYDIGMLPYAYPPPYNLASPNKFGEYIAAGLPIVANRQPFTSSIIEKFEIGIVFEWESEGCFGKAMAEALDPEKRDNWHANLIGTRGERLSWDKSFASSIGEEINRIKSQKLQSIHPQDGESVTLGPLGMAVSSSVRRWILKLGRRYISQFRPLLPLVGRWKVFERLMS